MKKITTGTENFKEFIDSHYYYVDKSNFIAYALQDKVSLFTRPRRFGKTLNMSMLYYFLSNKEKANAYLFDGLKITKNTEIMALQNRFPVISITLKNMKDMNFKGAIYSFGLIIQNIIGRNPELLTSPRIEEPIKNTLDKYCYQIPSVEELKNSLYLLSSCLEKHYQQKVILLIDEYDVPLQAAYQYGYYDEMTHFLGGLLGSALKTNDSLYKGIMTGCLRIAKESIFTGLNNFKVYSIFSHDASDCFGFTQEELDQILDYYHLTDYKAKIKEWYDGYLFGNAEIYNPWSTLYYISEVLSYPPKQPTSYWANTSSNDIVYNYIKESDSTKKEEFEALVQGQSIKKHILPELTYREMDNPDHIYSFLLFTGYLKVKKTLNDDIYELIIPNKEVAKIYREHFNTYFNESTKERKNKFVEALKKEDVDLANELLNEILSESISFYDNYERFYHGFMVGLLSGNILRSNRESGNGRFDITILPRNIFQRSIIIECKKVNSPLELENEASKAVEQIHDKKYIECLKQEGYRDVIGYGIAFWQKACYIVKA